MEPSYSLWQSRRQCDACHSLYAARATRKPAALSLLICDRILSQALSSGTLPVGLCTTETNTEKSESVIGTLKW